MAAAGMNHSICTLLISAAAAALLVGCGGGNEAEQHYKAGVELLNEDRLEEAIAEYDEAIRLNPDYAFAYIDRGVAYHNLGQDERATQDYDEAIRIDPQFALPYNNRGRLYFDLDQYERAIQDFDEAIRLDPEYGNAYASRAMAYTILRRDTEAQQDIDRILELGYNVRILTQRIELKKTLRDETPPTFEPLPIPTVPPSFVPYLDETSGFSIQYPQEWELAVSRMSELEERTKALLRSMEPGLPVGELGVLLFAGLRVAEGFEPTVNIAVASLPFEMSAFELYTFSNQDPVDFFPGYKTLTRTSTIMGHTEAIIEDTEFDYSFFEAGAEGKVRQISLSAVNGRVGWVVTCTASIGSAPTTEVLETCNAVVRTFRLLQ